MRYGTKWPQLAEWWDRMTILPEYEAQIAVAARLALNHKVEYVSVEAETGVTWYHIAALHHRESNSNFATYLGNGQRLDHVTTIVPKGRGPFQTWVDGAIDALNLDGLTNVIDWRLEKILYYCEIFNGTGYNNRGLPSPYVWAGTNIQERGKYVEDGHFDPRAWDKQTGCAPMIYAISQLDPTVKLTRES